MSHVILGWKIVFVGWILLFIWWCPIQLSLAIDKKEQCQLYIAPSTIPDGGWGMFTAVDIKEGEDVGSMELVIHVLDLIRHHGPSSFSELLFSQYDWQDAYFLGEFESNDTHTFVPGLGSAVNSHAAHHNIVPLDTVVTVDSLGVHRYHDGKESAGAFTYHFGAVAKSTKFIPAGSELYLFDGEQVFTDRQHTLGIQPLENDFQTADALMKLYTNFISTKKMSNSAKNDLWRIVLNTIENDGRKERLAAALPRSKKDIPNALSIGSAAYFTPLIKRSNHWLQTKGYCADNLHIQPSTIPNIGHGAFATRHIPKGHVISLLPLLHFTNPTIFDLYHLTKTKDDSRYVKHTNKIENKQLLLNYCFQHENQESPLLLLPYAPATNAINHNSQNSNSHLKWTKQSKEWLDVPLEELAEITDQSVFSMELIASRDIQKGEEIFLHYGATWEQAWDKHVQYIQQHGHYNRDDTTISSNNYQYPWQHSNNHHDTPFPIDGEETTAHENLKITCFYDFSFLYMDDTDIEELESFEIDGFHVYKIEYNLVIPEYASWYPCRVLNREELESDNDDDDDDLFVYSVILKRDDIWVLLNDTPSSAIKYMDKPYTSDTWLKTAFRHPLGIPDELFPDAWKTKQ